MMPRPEGFLRRICPELARDRRGGWRPSLKWLDFTRTRDEAMRQPRSVTLTGTYPSRTDNRQASYRLTSHALPIISRAVAR